MIVFCSFEQLIRIEPQWNVNLVNMFNWEQYINIRIEPQWNVNDLPASFLFVQSVNQNRTIVECKCIIEIITYKSRIIRIEPQWNVNYREGESDTKLPHQNRTIVECKFFLTFFKIFKTSNQNRTIVECKLERVLPQPKQEYYQNRTIVECKWGLVNYNKQKQGLEQNHSGM